MDTEVILGYNLDLVNENHANAMKIFIYSQTLAFTRIQFLEPPMEGKNWINKSDLYPLDASRGT